MTETREKKINNKVFTKNDIINLWHIFSSQHLSQKKDERTSPEMQVRCTDGTRYENKNEELLSQGNIFDIKKIESINFEYRSFLKEYKRITIELTHGNSNYRNILTVKGDEGLWVAGTFNKFEILLNSVKPQNNWFVNYQTSILILSTFFLSNVLLKIITYLYPQYLGNLYPHSISILDYIVGIFFFIVLGSILSIYLVNWVIKLWPNIEFDFGPEHEKLEKIRRTRIWSFFSLIIFPFLLSLIPFLN